MGEVEIREQSSRVASPWPRSELAKVALFRLIWALLCRWSPKPLIRWRNSVLRAFGAEIHGRPFVASSAVIRAPWRLKLADGSCLGPSCEVYNLGTVTLGERATVAQHAYLCGGSHDFSQDHLPLTTAPIYVGDDAFVGAKAILLPGVRIGRRAVVGAGAVVTRDVDEATIVAGNPARLIRLRDARPAKNPAAEVSRARTLCEKSARENI